MYLRCLVTREWAWYEPSSFLTAPEGGRARTVGAGPSRPRPAARRRAPAARRPRRAAAPKTRRKGGKKR
ncbi:MAG TPA: hypothetical protein VEW91_03135 [bacterium]|nr:hypothetical protein [bacterium]